MHFSCTRKGWPRDIAGYDRDETRDKGKEEGGEKQADNSLYTREPCAIFEVDNGVVYDWRH